MNNSTRWDDDDEGDDQFWDNANEDEDADDELNCSDIDANNHETFDNAAEWNEEEHDDLIAQDKLLSRQRVLDVDDIEKQLRSTKLTQSSSSTTSDNYRFAASTSEIKSKNFHISPKEFSAEFLQPHPMLSNKRSCWSPFGGKDFFNTSNDSPLAQQQTTLAQAFNNAPSLNSSIPKPKTVSELEIEFRNEQNQRDQLRRINMLSHQAQFIQQQEQQLEHSQRQLMAQQLIFQEQRQQQHLQQQQQQQQHQQQQQQQQQHVHQMQQDAIMQLRLLQQVAAHNQVQKHAQDRIPTTKPRIFTLEELEGQMFKETPNLPDVEQQNLSHCEKLREHMSQQMHNKLVTNPARDNPKLQESVAHKSNQHSRLGEKNNLAIDSHVKRDNDRNNRSDRAERILLEERNDRFHDRSGDRDVRGSRERVRTDKREHNRDRRHLNSRRVTIIPPQVQLKVLDKAKRLHSLTAMHSDEFLRDRMPNSVEGFVFNRHTKVNHHKPNHDGILTEEERSWLTRIQKKIQADYDGNLDQDYYYLLYFNQGSTMTEETNQKPTGSGVPDRRFIPRERLLYTS